MRRASPPASANSTASTGGGFVRGSALLVGGDPGIGKSTLLMQAAARWRKRAPRRLRLGRGGRRAGAAARAAARRGDAPVELAAETNVEDILATSPTASGPISSSSIRSRRCGPTFAESAPGTVTQVRASAQAMIRYAKSTGAAIVLVGHVTKEGQIAGPRVVEHMVDAVLYFEGEGGHHFRILRTVKNRFGPTDEIGVFEMSDKGLREVTNPSELFLGERTPRRPGAPSSPAWRARGRCWWRSRRWSPPPRSARRAAPSSAGIRRGCR
jgi:DNA repair protein RadA/Sms